MNYLIAIFVVTPEVSEYSFYPLKNLNAAEILTLKNPKFVVVVWGSALPLLIYDYNTCDPSNPAQEHMTEITR